MLQFLSQWLARDPARLGASLEEFVGHPAYGPRQLRQDLERFMFLLGGDDGESLFGPGTAEGPVTMASPLRGPKNPEEAASPPLTFLARRAGYGAAPPASRVLCIALRATALRAALDPGDHCGPWDQEKRAGPGLPPALRTARKAAAAGTVQAPEPEETMNWRSANRRRKITSIARP